MRLNLLQQLTGENFHKTHNLRFVSYDFAAKYKNAITLVVIGLFETAYERIFLGEEDKIKLHLLQHLTGITGASSVKL